MNALLQDHGIPVTIGTLHRPKDWTEPPAEGEWLIPSPLELPGQD